MYHKPHYKIRADIHVSQKISVKTNVKYSTLFLMFSQYNLHSGFRYSFLFDFGTYALTVYSDQMAVSVTHFTLNCIRKDPEQGTYGRISGICLCAGGTMFPKRPLIGILGCEDPESEFPEGTIKQSFIVTGTQHSMSLFQQHQIMSF